MDRHVGNPEAEVGAPPVRRRTLLLVLAGASSGFLWWWVSEALGGGWVGTEHPGLDLIAAAATGMGVAFASLRVYRSGSLRPLVWLVPVSLYLAVGAYVLLSRTLELAIAGPIVSGTSWSPGSGTTVHYDTGATIPAQIFFTWVGLSQPLFFVPLMALATVNHAALRWLAGASVTTG